MRRWEGERARRLDRVETRAERAERIVAAQLRQHERGRAAHWQTEPNAWSDPFGTRRKKWAEERDTIEQRIDRSVAQLRRIEALRLPYGNADWENSGAGERVAHRKAAAVLPELATAYLTARREVIERRGREAAAENARVAQVRRDEGQGRGRRR